MPENKTIGHRLQIQVGNNHLEQVNIYKYQSSLITHDDKQT